VQVGNQQHITAHTHSPDFLNTLKNFISILMFFFLFVTLFFLHICKIFMLCKILLLITVLLWIYASLSLACCWKPSICLQLTLYSTLASWSILFLNGSIFRPAEQVLSFYWDVLEFLCIVLSTLRRKILCTLYI